MAVLPDVHRAGGLIGAEIRGLDLTREYPDQAYQAVRQAWAEHGVIFFRGQHLTAEQRESFARRFGEIKTMQQLRKEPGQVKNVGESWHVDMTCFDEPPAATILFAQECPPYGGDTLWAGMGPAFEGLSEGLRRTLAGLRAVHANVRKLGPSYEQTSPPEPSIAEYDVAGGPLHPVVTVIPETGRRVLYVNPEYTTRFEGWTRRESLPLLIASLQYLPPRQRAVLILRDVLAFPATEVAVMLGTTTASVKSALQRARARLAVLAPAADEITEPTAPRARALLNQYIAAFENADAAALERLLLEDATLEATPLRTWFVGRKTCVPFLRNRLLGSPGDWRMLATSANGQPAAAAYTRDQHGNYQSYGICVLTVTGAGIRRISSFGDPRLVTVFGFRPDMTQAKDAEPAP